MKAFNTLDNQKVPLFPAVDARMSCTAVMKVEVVRGETKNGRSSSNPIPSADDNNDEDPPTSAQPTNPPALKPTGKPNNTGPSS